MAAAGPTLYKTHDGKARAFKLSSALVTGIQQRLTYDTTIKQMARRGLKVTARQALAKPATAITNNDTPKGESGTAAPMSQAARDAYFLFLQQEKDRNKLRDYWEAKYRSAGDRESRAEITRERIASEAQPQAPTGRRETAPAETADEKRAREERNVAEVMAALERGRGRGGLSR